MRTKILLIIISVVALSSCGTAYKSGQTPDDVYYSPVRVSEDEADQKRDEKKYEPARDYEITMGIRDHRWRDFRDDYRYDNSPYNYVTCNNYYGYYYNPFYYPWAIYTGKVTYSAPVNTTPRMVNLNTYRGYNSTVASSKTNNTSIWLTPSSRYNNNNDNNRSRQILYPSSNSSSSNSTRTYTPSSSSSSSSGSSSSGSSSSGSSVSRPGRGG